MKPARAARKTTRKTALRSTKGASKQRRDSLNTEIGQIRDLLPLSEADKQQLSQIQVMSLADVYIHMAKNLADLNENGDRSWTTVDKYDFTRALPGFMLAVTSEGKLLYLSENVTDHLGYSSIDLLTLGGTVYDIIDDKDQAAFRSAIQTKEDLTSKRNTSSKGQLVDSCVACRMKVSRRINRQSSCDRYKLMYIRGHTVALPQAQTKEEKEVNAEETRLHPRMFIGLCSPQPCTQPQDSTVFVSKHTASMKFCQTDENGEYHLGYTTSELSNKSWYSLLHPDDLQKATEAHLLAMSGRSSGSACVRLQTAYGYFLHTSILLEVRKTRASQQIVCSNRVLSESEAVREWPMLCSVPKKTTQVESTAELGILPYTSFTQLLLETDISTSTVQKSLQTIRPEKRMHLEERDSIIFSNELQKNHEEQNVITMFPSDTMQESPSCGNKYPVLSRMLLSRTTVCRSIDPPEVSPNFSTPQTLDESLPNSVISQQEINITQAPLNTMLTPDSSPVPVHYPQSPEIVCASSGTPDNFTPLSEQSQAEALLGSSLYLNSPPSTEYDYFYLCNSSDDDPIIFQQMPDCSATTSSFVPTTSDNSILPELDVMSLENPLLYENLNACHQESSSCSDIAQNIEQEDILKQGMIQYPGEAGSMNFESNGYSQTYTLDMYDLNSPASSGYQSEDCVNNSSNCYQVNVGIFGAPSVRPEPIDAVEDLLKPGSRFAGDKRMECLLNLLRMGLASGLISEDEVRNVRKGKCRIGTKLMELKKLYQRTSAKIDIFDTINTENY